MITAILQARFSSSRLPGKVLKQILARPMLVLQIERLQRSRLIDQLIVATSNMPDDGPIAQLSAGIMVECFRGSLDDVLDRFYQAAKLHSPQHIVRLTGDCPLADPELIDKLIEFYLSGNYDYASNTLNPTFPDGLDIEVFRFHCLEIAFREAVLPSHREHVTPFIHQQPERFSLGNYQNNEDLSYLRWTVDEQLDFELISQIYEALYGNNPEFTTQDVLNWLQHNPKWQHYNTRHSRNQGWEKSLIGDQIYISSL